METTKKRTREEGRAAFRDFMREKEEERLLKSDLNCITKKGWQV